MTYSIVGRDAATGELGIAVQTKNFRVGGRVPWARPGVGAIASQSFTDPGYGALGLELLAAGKSPEEALAALIAADRFQAHRQVGVVDGQGRAAAHTGEACIGDAGHLVGGGFTVQANMMRSARVWPAMAEAFAEAEGVLAERLLAALDAGEAAGGDFRGRQSAALLVVATEPRGAPWDAVVADVRVDDHAEPLAELRRLFELERAFRRLLELEDEADLDGTADEARAAGVAEDHVVWLTAHVAARRGGLDEGWSRLAPLIAEDEHWRGAFESLLLALERDRE